MATLFIRQYLLLFAVIFVAYLLLKSLLFHRAHSINPAQFLKSKHKAESFLWLWLMFIMLLYVFVAVLYYYGIAGPYLGQNLVVDVIGMMLTTIGFVFMVIAQSQMGEDWRMGNDEQNRITLRAQGLFRYSRNPVYTSILILSFGLTMILRTLIGALLFLLLFLTFRIIIHTEERFLTEKFGQQYLDYKNKVRRFI